VKNASEFVECLAERPVLSTKSVVGVTGWAMVSPSIGN